MTSPEVSSVPRSARRCRLLVLHAGALGDLILTLHFLDRIRPACSQETTLVARCSWGLWAAKQGLVDAAFLMDRIGFHAVHGEASDVSDELRRFLGSFDHVLSLLGDPGNSVSQRLGDLVGRHKLTCIDPRPTPRTLQLGIHIVEQWFQDWRVAASTLAGDSQVPANSIWRPQGCLLAEADATGSNANAEAPQLPGYSFASSAQSASSADTSSIEDKRIVLLHPGSGGLDKCLPLEVLEEVASAITSGGDLLQWMIGPDEIERWGEGFADRLRMTATVVWQEHPEKAVGALQRASAYIGMDAGMTHVAAMLGVPTLAIFGPTDPRVWRPPGSFVRCVGFPEEAESLASWIEKLCAELRGIRTV